jgi:hypothetical protein
MLPVSDTVKINILILKLRKQCDCTLRYQQIQVKLKKDQQADLTQNFGPSTLSYDGRKTIDL